jgi:hypothetical protein
MPLDDGRMTETCCGNDIRGGEEELLLNPHEAVCKYLPSASVFHPFRHGPLVQTAEFEGVGPYFQHVV